MTDKEFRAEQRRRRIRNYLPHLPGDILKILAMVIFVFPFYWMVITSFKTLNESISVPPTMFPFTFNTEAYYIVVTKMNWWSYVRNTVIITISVIVLQLLVMVPASYAFAKFRFYGAGVFFGTVLIAFMIPTQITFITTYLTMADWKLLKTLWPQIIPFGANAFGIFMLRQSFKQIPDEIVESAKLDKASEVQIMTRILLPMSKSAMITIALFSFVGHWNSYFWPLVMSTSEEVRPLTIAIEKLKEIEYGIQWPQIMAGNTLLVLPVVILYIFASKKIIQAFAYRGVK
ncbi:MAG: carbohydrate ABC transporter permease [Clostridia bacterium]|nr:carbohydrate ABC transporter permease [Clostridia bacterium]